jgi:hypothetical protein
LPVLRAAALAWERFLSTLLLFGISRRWSRPAQQNGFPRTDLCSSKLVVAVFIFHPHCSSFDVLANVVEKRTPVSASFEFIPSSFSSFSSHVFI